MIVYTNPDLKNSISGNCQCRGCNFPATKYCKILPLPEYISLCDHCTVDLGWHGIVNEVHGDNDDDHSAKNRGSKRKDKI
jgi:hypothetical protein